MRHTHLLTILYADQQSINKVPKIWGQLNEKGNGSSPDPFLARLWRALRKKKGALKKGLHWYSRLYCVCQCLNVLMDTCLHVFFPESAPTLLVLGLFAIHVTQ